MRLETAPTVVEVPWVATMPAVVGAAAASVIVVRALVHPHSVLTFAVLAIIGLLLVRPVVRRFEVSWLLAAVALLSVAGVLAVTVVPDGGYAQLGALAQPVSLSRWWTYMSDGWGEALTGWMSGTDGPMNVALFVFPALLWTLILRRFWPVLGIGIGLSLFIETYQGVTGTRAAGPADLVANTLGVLIGIALATGLMRLRRS